MTLEVVYRHENLGSESGVEFMSTVSEGCVRDLRFLVDIIYTLKQSWLSFLIDTTAAY